MPGDMRVRKLLATGRLRGFSAAPRIFVQDRARLGSANSLNDTLAECRDGPSAAAVTRVAFFEFSMVHQEVQPSFRAAFSAIGWSATFFVLPSRFPGRPLSAFPQTASPADVGRYLGPADRGAFNVTFEPLHITDEHRATRSWRPTAEMMHYDVYVLGSADVAEWRAAFLGAFAGADRILFTIQHNLHVAPVPTGPLHRHLALGRPPRADLQPAGGVGVWHAVADQVAVSAKPRKVRFCVVGLCNHKCNPT